MPNLKKIEDGYEYLKWLSGYISKGGKITHYYDYPITRWDWFLAEENFRTGGECGSRSVSIIVAPGVKWVGVDIGHNKIYFMDDFKVEGFLVPAFNDLKFNTDDEKLLGAIKEMKAESVIAYQKFREKRVKFDDEWGGEYDRWERECEKRREFSDVPRSI